MVFDFNEAEEQKEFVSGPVPAGSTVLVKVEIQRPSKAEYAAKPGSYVCRTSKGLFTLNCLFTVQAGSYAGYHWYDNFMLPEGVQRVELTAGQKEACRIAYSRMRAIIEAHRKIDPKDQSPRANAGRKLNDWMDLNGMVFPCRLGLKKEPRTFTRRDGSQGIAWDNQISFILPVTHKNFNEIVTGGEIITDGPVQGDMPANNRNGFDYANNGNSGNGEVPGWDTPPLDDVPF